MNCQQRLIHPTALLSAALICVASCGPGSEVTLEASTPIKVEGKMVRVDVSSAERFGFASNTTQHSADDGHDHGADVPGASPFVWELPPTWMELPKAQFREINLQPAGDPELQCYMTILSGDGGGVAANLNRWRGQLGLEPADEASFANLPTTVLFKGIAQVLELEGTFSGMGGEPLENYGMIGVILLTPQFTVTVKMTGPKEKAAAERGNFDAFIASLGVEMQTEGPPPETDPNSGGGGDLTYAMPEGWSALAPKGMRIINLDATPNTQCYLIMMPGAAGGLLGNLNRWRGEVGYDAFTQADAEALPTVPVLGEDAYLLEVSGDYQGMGGANGEDQTLLGVCLIGEEQSSFIKMVGPRSEVAEQKANFIAFLASLEN